MAVGIEERTDHATSPLDHPWRITIDRYWEMIEAGILRETDRVYLWKGRLVERMGKNPPHVIAVTKLGWAMLRLLPAGYFPLSEQPMEIPDDGVPEPDLTIVRGTIREYSRRTPTVRDVLLIGEVSDSTLGMDRGDKLSVYAAQSLPTYWLVDLRGRKIEVFTDPTGPCDEPTYRQSRSFGPGETIPVVLDGREVGRVAVDEILP